MPEGTSRYLASLTAARDVALRLAAEQTRALLGILEEYAREVEARVAAGLESRTAATVLAEVAALVDEMSRTLAAETGDGVRLTARRLAEIQAEATARLLADAGGRIAAAAAFGGTGARAAAAVLARPELAEAFVSIRRETSAAVNTILRRGLVRGAPARAIAREIRQYIAMPDSLLEADATLLADRRRIGYAAVERLGYERTPENLALVRQEASRIAYRASTIARTEVANAEAEVLVQGAIDSPVVAAVVWSVSYTHRLKDPCDRLAETDLYGLGPGVFDPRQVPVRPHPRCRCKLTHRLRPESEWGAERGPLPDLKVDVEREAEAAGLSPSEQRAFVAAVRAGGARTPELVEV